MKKIYIKFFGTSGTGKTATIRELSKVLTGNKISTWNNIKCPPIIAFSTCDCRRYAAIGMWIEGKREGMDTLRAGDIKNPMYGTPKKFKNNKEKLVFNFKEKIENNLLSYINSEVIFEDGLVTASPGIHEALDKKFELYTFHMDYPIEFCMKNYIARGSVVQVDITEKMMNNKIKEAKNTFNKLQVKNKFKLSGTIEENVAKIIEIANLKKCLCMKDKIICEDIHKETIKKKSLFD